MSKNIKNRLTFMLVAVILFLVVFNVIAFAVPFTNHYNSLFWVSYAFYYLEIIPTVFALFIAGNTKDYDNDECGNKISIVSGLVILIGIVASIIFMAVTIEQIWIPIVVLALVFVLSVLAIFYVFIQNKNDKDESDVITYTKTNNEAIDKKVENKEDNTNN